MPYGDTRSHSVYRSGDTTASGDVICSPQNISCPCPAGSYWTAPRLSPPSVYLNILERTRVATGAPDLWGNAPAPAGQREYPTHTHPEDINMYKCTVILRHHLSVMFTPGRCWRCLWGWRCSESEWQWAESSGSFSDEDRWRPAPACWPYDSHRNCNRPAGSDRSEYCCI